MDEMEIMRIIKNTNQRTLEFYENELPKIMKLKDNVMTLSDWFAAQEHIRKAHIYENAVTVLQCLRGAGYDVKINMQDYTLSYYGKIDREED